MNPRVSHTVNVIDNVSISTTATAHAARGRPPSILDPHTASPSLAGPHGHRVIERTVTGLGYDLVEVERAPRGLLRVTIDRVPGHAYPVVGSGGVAGDSAAAVDRGIFVTVDDCERVTRQLQYALEVDGVAYERLEVSSPGLDRLLRHEADFLRFAGQPVALTLKQPFQGRKHWKGTLVPQDPPQPQAWRLLTDEGRAGAGVQALAFRLDELREARLVPVLDFKGRGGRRQGGAAPVPAGKDGAVAAPRDGGQER